MITKKIVIALLSITTIFFAACSKEDNLSLGGNSIVDGGNGSNDDNGSGGDNNGGGDTPPVTSTSIIINEVSTPDNLDGMWNSFFYVVKSVYKEGEKPVIFIEQTVKLNVDEESTTVPSLSIIEAVCTPIIVNPINVTLFSLKSWDNSNVASVYKVSENSGEQKLDLIEIGGENVASDKNFNLEVKYSARNSGDIVNLKIYGAIEDSCGNIVSSSQNSYLYKYVVK